jgi:hypothetical protein
VQYALPGLGAATAVSKLGKAKRLSKGLFSGKPTKVQKAVQTGKELGAITVIIRWKQGQMAGYPDTTSSAKWNINNDEWAEIFN